MSVCVSGGGDSGASVTQNQSFVWAQPGRPLSICGFSDAGEDLKKKGKKEKVLHSVDTSLLPAPKFHFPLNLMEMAAFHALTNQER